jgi:hypothetical protein
MLEIFLLLALGGATLVLSVYITIRLFMNEDKSDK